jgi:dsRNA-specific ribonuclease
MAHPSMLPKIMQCQKILSYYFTDQHLCWEALQMAGNGITSSGPRHIGDGNKRLAILGDQVLGLVLSQDWYRGGAMLGMLSPLSS